MSGFGKVAVLMGGRSAEREISLKSGTMILGALKRQGIQAEVFDPAEQDLLQLAAQRYERVFIALHGRQGEDGTIQGALECMGIPYTGSGVLASALAMDKWRTKLVWLAAGVATPDSQRLTSLGNALQVVDRLGFPLMVKPAHEGSSIGISKVDRVEQMQAAYEQARDRDDVVIAERFVSGRELTVAILGEKALPVIRIEAPQGNYDFHHKYFSDQTQYFCPSGLSPQLEASIQEQALVAFHLLGCEGWGRLDVILDDNDRAWFLEANTVPGMTDHSLVPMAAKASGLSFENLVLRILEAAHVG
jgi:D-alanine-D-alanine ligase